MIVELVGVPGSGKTTFANHLARTLPDLHLREAKHSGPVQKFKSKLKTGATYRRSIAAGLNGLLRDSRPLQEKMLAVRWLISTFEPFLTDDRRTRHTVLTEGPIQRTLLLFYDARNASWNDVLLGKYLRTAPKSDVVIYLDIDPELAAQRYRARAESLTGRATRFETSPISLDEQFHSISKVLGECVASAHSDETPVIRVRSPQEGAEALRLLLIGS